MLHKTRHWGTSFGMCVNWVNVCVNWVNTEAEQSIGLYVLPGLKINTCMFPTKCVCGGCVCVCVGVGGGWGGGGGGGGVGGWGGGVGGWVGG
jgi:hypothetical protein